MHQEGTEPEDQEQGGSDSCQVPQPAGERLRMEQGCVSRALGSCPSTSQHPWILMQPLCSRCTQGQTPAESDGATHIFLLMRQGKPGLLLGFWEQCSDAGLELLLGSSPARLSLAQGASPSHPDTPSLTFPRQILTDFPPLCCNARGQGWQAAAIQPDLPGLLPFL